MTQNHPDTNLFPNRPVPAIILRYKLWRIKRYFKNQHQIRRLSDLVPRLNKYSLAAWKEIVSFNPNNIGNWSLEKTASPDSTYYLEQAVVRKLSALFAAPPDATSGYVTSGGSESNLFSVWLGIKYLETYSINRSQINLLATDLTHYSLRKAADIAGVKSEIVPLDDSAWVIDVASLIKRIRTLHARGYSGFLLPLTFGYTLTGTIDPVDRICAEMEKLTSDLSIRIFVWVDASFNGLIEPFINPDFAPFKPRLVQAFTTDFHKTGQVPLSAGLLLYRRTLNRLIANSVDYLTQKDATLLGSRSGVPAAAIWASIHAQGRSGFRKNILRAQKRKADFLQTLSAYRDISIITDSRSLHCAIIAAKLTSEIKNLSQKYGLEFKPTTLKFVSQTRNLLISKCFFLN